MLSHEVSIGICDHLDRKKSDEVDSRTSSNTAWPVRHCNFCQVYQKVLTQQLADVLNVVVGIACEENCSIFQLFSKAAEKTLALHT